MTDYQTAKIPMTEVLAWYGLQANRSGFLCCPFHAEKTASCRIYEKSFYCFGCGAGGDAVSFVSKMENIPPAAALQQIRKRQGISPETDYRSYRANRREQYREKQREQQESRRTAELERTLLSLHRTLYQAGRGKHTGEPSGLWLLSLHQTERVDFLLEELTRIGIVSFETVYGKEVNELVGMVGREADRKREETEAFI